MHRFASEAFWGDEKSWKQWLNMAVLVRETLQGDNWLRRLSQKQFRSLAKR